MTRQTTEILNKMESLLAKPEAWTQGVWARDKNGEPIEPTSDGATCFCLHGARRRAVWARREMDTALDDAIRDRLSAAAVTLFPDRAIGSKDRPGHKVVGFNDHPDTTHADVLQVVRLAAAI
ncbi:hypothetical protein [Methylobacterium ajmalii]|uniref:DUF6197 family protein n=1 Tax=Methylobacterium ajmalii TaxID=2738439 RepID=UPI002F355828